MRPTFQIPHLLLLDAAGQEGLVSKAQCDAVGVDKRHVSQLVQQRRWSRVTRGVYDTDPVPVAQRRRPDYHEHVRRRIAWTALLAYDDAVATGSCALALYGVSGLPRVFLPEVALPGGAGAPGRGGIVVRQYRPFPTQGLKGRTVAQLVPALAQAVPTLPRDNAVAVLSSCLHEGYIDHQGLAHVHDLVRGRRGAARCHSWFGLADGRDESAAETFARLSCLDHHVPPDGQQVDVFRDGVFLARVDLVYRLPDGRWVLVEIDGIEFHGRPGALARDARRQNDLVGTDQVVVLRYAASENDRPGGVGRQIAERLRMLGWEPGHALAVDESIDLGSPVRRPARVSSVRATR
ncbi:hypothetical protein ACFQHV_19560 [Promicromonospora thailandica]|uniref:Uncharacterized protein n=1 Tax=Promicromonospora thailandica TaxID=765201 RepID=A0A9X2G073_9MICO|nr:type IV toxin-antitoxin system AbiEi family antitoxin domain-containing protein [Promicromonospora thailandica]MCP2262978.1 hypothetical protein [Promicromonospora thailandica]BFF18342.1 hypothetical protein GCM10025730_18630 [Promicromonospora thailandica]